MLVVSRLLSGPQIFVSDLSSLWFRPRFHLYLPSGSLMQRGLPLSIGTVMDLLSMVKSEDPFLKG